MSVIIPQTSFSCQLKQNAQPNYALFSGLAEDLSLEDSLSESSEGTAPKR